MKIWFVKAGRQFNRAKYRNWYIDEKKVRNIGMQNQRVGKETDCLTTCE